LTRKLAARHKKSVRWIGIDCESKMIDQATKEINDASLGDVQVDLLVDDINLFDYEPADLMLAYYTVQFVPPRLRQDLINRIYQSLNWGGAFILFEKVRGPDARFQDIFANLYSDFKLENGYSPEEILAKTRSLKGVLEPFSTQGNLDLLQRAGFVDVTTIFKWVCFEGFLCIK
jgi:tRNA (cmo5U34)-methyltransferase